MSELCIVKGNLSAISRITPSDHRIRALFVSVMNFLWCETMCPRKSSAAAMGVVVSRLSWHSAICSDAAMQNAKQMNPAFVFQFSGRTANAGRNLNSLAGADISRIYD